MINMHSKLLKTIFMVISILFLLFISKKYYDQSTSFAFVDEYDNIAAAHQMIKGKKLFSEVFHNRQIGPVYMSYVIQKIVKPQTLYQLITVHRLFIITFSLSFSILFLLRFGLLGFGFPLLFEPIKYYFHGNLFLGESMIVYPIAYLVLLLFEKSNKIFFFDTILVGFFSWFIIFSREPYIPLVIFLFILVFIKQKDLKGFILSSTIVFLLSLIAVFGLNLKDYFFQLFVVNRSRITGNSFDKLDNVNLFTSLTYPISVLFSDGKWNHLRQILSVYSLTLMSLILYFLVIFKKYRLILISILLLAFSAIRVVNPGTVFYGAYRTMVWISLLIILTLIYLRKLIKSKKNIAPILFIFPVIFLFSIFSKESFILKKIDKVQSFDINYNRFFVNGEVIKLLSHSGDTLFVDGYDSLLFWQADIKSAYKYSFYYPNMKDIQTFDKAKELMFKKNPPTFYFIDCVYRNINPIPKVIKNDYLQFIYSVTNDDTCLYVNKVKLASLDNERLDSIKKYNYFLNLSPK
ncbi:MAG: hypothetical protein UR68_C0026G0006 [Candidatus Roizmanbacteria bacterium GW2011_GWA2_35_19]|uniref:Glycosyltransferase RgtA/B/C/D-like domain-containing protein n=2 Tax=Candidatus Roizmaniibacteriota TaxID=1752723 RepID=A0A0G0EXG1_9BACT|nr:MAG: hypothetical protein UR63_C0009G0019 [Candidatus Roizmanbacteria bacterium GW2011_GWC2_35_12]KKP71837.1 MAG: hypothetical protein UR68_C0026G0006 [Candidatus Roizmanbacteria bacterium GW2011_GWA2_35_19]